VSSGEINDVGTLIKTAKSPSLEENPQNNKAAPVKESQGQQGFSYVHTVMNNTKI
jgi:hypothetical protein